MTFTVADWKAGKPLPKGWDVADAERDGWSKRDVLAFIKKFVSSPKSADGMQPRPECQAGRIEQAQPAEIVDIRTGSTLAEEEPWKRQIVFNADGVPKPSSTNNHQLFLTHHEDVRGMLALNEFSRQIMLQRCPPWQDAENWQPRPIEEEDNVDIVAWLERDERRLAPKVSGIFSVVASVARKNAFDPLRDYLEYVRWDGVPRVATFLRDYLGAEERGDYSRIISKRWLISAVARALLPGCKMDDMLVLEGPQGARKSTAVRVLFGEEFWTDHISDFNSKDAKQEIQGVWAVEVAEMDRVTKAEQDHVKKFLSQKVDRYRPPYGRHLVVAQRRCVLVGTINPDGTGYLKDPTGARRFWPMKIGRIDIEAIQRDRDQIWAEAVTFYKNGEKWWIQEDEKAIVQEQQVYRTEPDAWGEMLGNAIGLMDDTITMSDCIRWLNLPADRVELRHTMRIGRVLKSLGFERRRFQTEDGQWSSKYVRSEER
ncbi:MAG: virulence-associated E family protein [Stappiaceae bacterium]